MMTMLNKKSSHSGADDINQDLDRQSETSKDMRENLKTHDPDRLKKENQKENSNTKRLNMKEHFGANK